MLHIPPIAKPSLPVTDALGAQLDLEISAIAREALERLGRTEDIRFRPATPASRLPAMRMPHALFSTW